MDPTGIIYEVSTHNLKSPPEVFFSEMNSRK